MADLPSRLFARMPSRPIAFGAALVCTCAAAQVALPPAPAAELARCAEIAASVDRLACYDKLAGRAPPPVPPPATAGATPPSTSALAPALRVEPGGSGSLLSRYWELERSDKRGVFNFVGYRANYILPVHLTSRLNTTPQSPTQARVDLAGYRKVEAKIQLSLRTKLVQSLVLPDSDLWFAFTQQSLWQVWNTDASSPFRNTDYEPELIYMVPVPQGLRALPGGWQWRYASLALAHQSNGQADPLSRSWNRVWLGAGVERGDVSLLARVLRRIQEPRADDNNPDLTDYRGRAELQLNWTPGLATASLSYRNSLRRLDRGSLQLEWTYPVYDDQPNGLRWYVQAFTGYGETLTDYNFRQSSIGFGLTFLQF
jgi:phospholipase A1